jgi:hypothetical protein
MYKLPPLVTRPNRRMPYGINMIELLQLPAYRMSWRREQVGGETRISDPFSHRGPSRGVITRAIGWVFLLLRIIGLPIW